MKGTRPQNLPAPSRARGDGDRTCAEPRCTTRLSRYNADDRCWQHADATFPNYRGKRSGTPPGA